MDVKMASSIALGHLLRCSLEGLQDCKIFICTQCEYEYREILDNIAENLVKINEMAYNQVGHAMFCFKKNDFAIFFNQRKFIRGLTELVYLDKIKGQTSDSNMLLIVPRESKLEVGFLPNLELVRI